MKIFFFLLFLSITQYGFSQENLENKDTNKINERLKESVSSPLNDFNINNKNIPQILQNNKDNPYSIPSDTTCHALKEEIKLLNDVLGPDINDPRKDDSDFATDTAIKALNNTVQGAIPYRNWIRKLSGAEKYEKNLDICIKAGNIRRAFLKGILYSQQCE